MSRRKCTCTYCGSPAPQIVAQPVHQPVVLPDQPRAFRVHHDGRTQDCTLHPDGRMTMQVGEQVLESVLSFDEMRERNWAQAHIEWDPPAQAAEDDKPEPIQDHIEGLAA